jgi:hypothetical protein
MTPAERHRAEHVVWHEVLLTTLRAYPASEGETLLAWMMRVPITETLDRLMADFIHAHPLCCLADGPPTPLRRPVREFVAWSEGQTRA